MTDPRPAASSVCALSRYCLIGPSNQSLFGPLTFLVTTGLATTAAQGQGHGTGLPWGRGLPLPDTLGPMGGLSVRHKGGKKQNCEPARLETPAHQCFTSRLGSLAPLEFNSTGTRLLTSVPSPSSLVTVSLFLGLWVCMDSSQLQTPSGTMFHNTKTKH